MVDADIHDFGFDAVMTRQNVDCSAAAKKVVSHLRRDFLRVSADSFLRDAVVRGKNEKHLAPQPRRNSALNDGDAARQLFEFSQASLRLGQRVEALLGRAFDRTIKWANFFECLGQRQTTSFLTIIGMPATTRRT